MEWHWPQYTFAVLYGLQGLGVLARAQRDANAVIGFLSMAVCAGILGFAVYTLHVGGFW